MALRTIDNDVLLSGVVSGKAGVSANDHVVGGILYVTTTAVGNIASASDTNLATYSVPANTLETNGQSIWFEAMLITVGSANPLRIRVSFGGTVFFEISAAPAATPMVISGKIIRTGATAQKAYAGLISGLSSFYTYVEYNTVAATLANANNLIIAGQHSIANVITLQSLIVGYDGMN